MSSQSTNLQVYIDTGLRNKGEKKAQEYGFTSLQDLVRFFIKGVVEDRYVPTLVSEREQISLQAEKRLLKELREFERQKRTGKAAKSAKALVRELEK